MSTREIVCTAPGEAQAAGARVVPRHHRRSLAAGAVGLYLVLTIWKHRAVNDFILSFRHERDTAAWNRDVGMVLAPPAVLAAGWLVWRAWRHPARRVLLTYALLTMALSAAGLRMLMAVNTEAVHLAQYAILAMLIYPLTGRLFDAIVATTLCGIADEAVQYWVHYRHWGIYMDFNDCALNVLGAAYGALAVVVLRPARGRGPLEPGGRRTVLHVLAIGLAACLALAATGRLVNVAPADASGWVIALNRGQPYTSFWTPLNYGRAIHIVRPWEGAALIVVLLALYAPLDAAVARAMGRETAA